MEVKELCHFEQSEWQSTQRPSGLSKVKIGGVHLYRDIVVLDKTTCKMRPPLSPNPKIKL